MLLSELTLPIAYADCKDLALVYPYEVAVALYNAQEEHGDPRHTLTGQPLTDGRYLIAGEMLTEIGRGGLFGWIGDYLTQELMAAVEVVPMSEVVELLPEAPSQP